MTLLSQRALPPTLVLFMRYLSSHNVPYCVVGNTENLCSVIEGDVDIIIPERQIKGIHSIVMSFCREHGFRIVQCLQHENNAFYYVIQWYERDIPKFLKIDVCGDYYRKARLFLTAAELLSKATVAEDNQGGREQLFNPAPATEFIYYLLKKVDKGNIDENQAIHLHNQWRKDPQGCAGNIRRFWNEADCALIETAAQSNYWDPVIQAIPRLRRAVHRNVHFTWKGIYGELLRKIRRVLFPTGLTAVFLGPDGSGKSSIIAALRVVLLPAFRKQTVYHLRPFLLGAPTTGNQGRVANPHHSPPYGTVLSAIKLVYLWLDYAIGYYTVILWKNVSSTFVLFDRYFFDILVDPKRFRYGGPVWWATVVGKMIPKPNIYIFLSAPADTIQHRKKEVRRRETVRQNDSYMRMASVQDQSIIIDTKQPLDDSVKEASRFILNFLADRTAKRLLRWNRIGFLR